jgi:hypothetical protein
VKISELIGTLSTALGDVGDAEVCVSVEGGDDALITSVGTGLNIEVPTRGTVNIVVLKGEIPDPA